MSSISLMDDHSHEDPSKSVVRLENTYQLAPDRKFLAAAAHNILQEVVDGYLTEEKYDPELCRQMARTIADVVKARVKELLFARLVGWFVGWLVGRYVCNLFLGSGLVWNNVGNVPVFSCF